jgi:hypothetical protein
VSIPLLVEPGQVSIVSGTPQGDDAIRDGVAHLLTDGLGAEGLIVIVRVIIALSTSFRDHVALASRYIQQGRIMCSLVYVIATFP